MNDIDRAISLIRGWGGDLVVLRIKIANEFAKIRDETFEECAQWCDDQDVFKGDLHGGIPGDTYRHTAAALRAKKKTY